MLVLHLDHVYVCVRISRGAEDVLFVECRVLQIVHPIVGIGLPTEPSKKKKRAKHEYFCMFGSKSDLKQTFRYKVL